MTVELEELAARLRRVEDELAIQQVILTYGPAADAGLTDAGRRALGRRRRIRLGRRAATARGPGRRGADARRATGTSR